MPGTPEQDRGLVHASAQRPDVLLAARQQLGEREPRRAMTPCSAASASAVATTSADDDDTPRRGRHGRRRPRSVAPAGRRQPASTSAWPPPAGSFPSRRRLGGDRRRGLEAPGQETGGRRLATSIQPSPSARRGDQDVAVDRERQHRQPVVVGVLADDVHPARRARDHDGPAARERQPRGVDPRADAGSVTTRDAPGRSCCSSSRAAAAPTPGVTAMRWFSRRSRARSYSEPAAPAFGSAQPKTRRATRACSAAPMHIAHGSTVDVERPPRAGGSCPHAGPRRAQGADLGVPARVVRGDAGVARPREHPAVPHHDRPDRHLAPPRAARDACRSATSIQCWSASVGMRRRRRTVQPYPRPTVSRASAPRRSPRPASAPPAAARSWPRPAPSALHFSTSDSLTTMVSATSFTDRPVCRYLLTCLQFTSPAIRRPPRAPGSPRAPGLRFAFVPPCACTIRAIPYAHSSHERPIPNPQRRSKSYAPGTSRSLRARPGRAATPGGQMPVAAGLPSPACVGARTPLQRKS